MTDTIANVSANDMLIETEHHHITPMFKRECVERLIRTLKASEELELELKCYGMASEKRRQWQWWVDYLKREYDD